MSRAGKNPAGGRDYRNGPDGMRHNPCKENHHMKNDRQMKLKRVKDLSYSDMKVLLAGGDPRIPTPKPTCSCLSSESGTQASNNG